MTSLVNRQFSRRAVAAGLASFAWPAVRACAAPVVVRIGHFPNITHVQALVARNFERKGKPFFAPRLGSDIKIEWYAYNAGPSAIEAIFAGAVDLTYVGPNPALNGYARSKGEDIRVIGGAVNGGSALVVQPDGGLAKPEDFRGKRIATPQFGNTQDVAARAWLIAGGLKVTQTGGDAQVVPTQNPDQLALFKQKQIDAVWTVEPWVSRLELEAGGRVLVEAADDITTIFTASAKFLSGQPDLARRAADANKELTAWINANKDEALAMAAEELRLSFRADLSADVVKRAFGRLKVSAEVSPDAFGAFITAAQKVGFLKDMPDIARFFAWPK
jgi:NitT/TauT family transport system substrate-binding protein